MGLLARDPALRPDAIGHRLVHGGDRFRENMLLDAQNEADLEKVAPLAPLHNPPAIALIRACRERYPDLPQAIIFDTAFHSTIPDYARTYALPAALRRGMGLRKYGFHGISHQYVCGEAARFWACRSTGSTRSVATSAAAARASARSSAANRWTTRWATRRCRGC